MYKKVSEFRIEHESYKLSDLYYTAWLLYNIVLVHGDFLSVWFKFMNNVTI